MAKFYKKAIIILFGFLVMNLVVIMLPLGDFFYFIAGFVFLIPIVLSLFSKSTERVRMNKIKMTYGSKRSIFFTNRIFPYFCNVIVGMYFAFVLPTMIYLMDLSEYVSMFVLLIFVFIINKCVIKGSLYKKEFVGESENTRSHFVYFIEASIYPIVWIWMNTHLPDTELFGSLENLSGIAKMLGFYVDMVNSIVRVLSDNMAIFFVLIFLFMVANGGIIFIGLYRFFDGLMLDENAIGQCFLPLNYNIVAIEEIQRDKKIKNLSRKVKIGNFMHEYLSRRG